MKSKKQKIQILMKGMAILLIIMLSATPIVYATSSLDDSDLNGSWLDRLQYGKIGSTVKEIEEYFNNHTTLYISNETQLRALAEYVNNGHNCSNKDIVLLNDIKVNSEQEWVPIGTEKAPFAARTFDGAGYTISGINFNRNNKLYSEITNVGIFGRINGTTIRNITLANSKFDIPYNVSNDILISSEDIEAFADGMSFACNYRFLGGIIGYNVDGTIENCTINSDVIVKGMANVGGIVGSNIRGTIKNCVNNGSISGFSNVGGIAGGNYGRLEESIVSSSIIDFSKEDVGKIIGCTNGKNGDIYALIGAVGGIAGTSTNHSIIQKCSNAGRVNLSTELLNFNIKGEKVTYDPQNVGGIVGLINGGIDKTGATVKRYSAIDGCINWGSVKGYRDVGGIVGQLAGIAGGYAILSNCIAYSEDIVATIKNSEVGEAGFLAGEVGTWGNDKEDRSDDSIAIIYNNLYFLSDEKNYKEDDASTKDAISAYGRIAKPGEEDAGATYYYREDKSGIIIKKEDSYYIQVKTKRSRSRRNKNGRI